MIDMSVSGLGGPEPGPPSPISWVWGRPTTAPKPTPSRCYHQNHNPNFPTLVGVTRSSGKPQVCGSCFPHRGGDRHTKTEKGEGTHQWVPSPVLCEGYRVTDPG